MLVRVDGMVWLPKAEVGPDMVSYLRRELTLHPKQVGNFGGDKGSPAPIKCYLENGFEIGVPRAWWFGKSTKDYDYDFSKVSSGRGTIEYESSISCTGPYAEQQEVVDAYVAAFAPALEAPSAETMPHAGAMFRAMTGFGKTNCSLQIVYRLGTTALIVVHKEFLARQWARRIERYLPGARVGFCQGPVCDFEDKDFVIGMVQSLSLEDGNRYPDEFYSWPGILIFDEAHRVGAPTASTVPPMFQAAARLGLTATPRRKDGCDDVFWWHLGPVLKQGLTETPKPGVRLTYVASKNIPAVANRDGVSPAIVTNVIVKLRERNTVVVNEIVKALLAPAKRKIMVLSDRLEHLRHLEAALRKRDPVDGLTTSHYVGEWFTGETPKPLRKGKWPEDDAGRAKAIQAIYQSFNRRRKGVGCVVVPFVGDHIVDMEGVTINAMSGLIGDRAHPDDAIFSVKLEDLSWPEIYWLAREFKVRQKVVEKKKTLTEEDLALAERAQVIFCTVQMVAEGVDIPAVDTLVLATPISDVEQAVGRIRRFCTPVAHGGLQPPSVCEHLCPWRAPECTGKKNLVVVDVIDSNVPMAVRRFSWRERFYQNAGFKMARAKA